jgi:hypothetical protein
LDSYHHTGGSWTEYSGTSWTAGNNGSISLRCSEGLIASRMYVMSDLRIKTDISDIIDDEALIKFRKLQPKKYKYIDKLKYKDNEVYGFIAQEVGEILPNAVTYEKDYIPDIMLTAEVLKLDENKTKLTTNENHNLNQNDIIRCKTSKYQDLDNIKVLEVIDEKTIIIDYIFNEEEIKFKDEDNVIIIYGRLIEDFNILNKETIWTLTTSALQEVDRQLQQEKNKIMEQENKPSYPIELTDNQYATVKLCDFKYLNNLYNISETLQNNTLVLKSTQYDYNIVNIGTTTGYMLLSNEFYKSAPNENEYLDDVTSSYNGGIHEIKKQTDPNYIMYYKGASGNNIPNIFDTSTPDDANQSLIFNEVDNEIIIEIVDNSGLKIVREIGWSMHSITASTYISGMTFEILVYASNDNVNYTELTSNSGNEGYIDFPLNKNEKHIL